jgi:hypothetical protein
MVGWCCYAKLRGAWLCGLSSVPQGSGLSRLRSSHVAVMETSQATLLTMTAASETENAPFDTALPLNVASSSASFHPNTYCLNEEEFVVSLLSSGAVGKNEDTTPAVGGEKTGVASSAGG